MNRSPDRRPSFRIGIDTGGTFTDIVAVDSDSGRMLVTKVASTPANPSIGLAQESQPGGTYPSEPFEAYPLRYLPNSPVR